MERLYEFRERILSHPDASTGLSALGCLALAMLLLATHQLFLVAAPLVIEAAAILFLMLGTALLSKIGIAAFERRILS